MIISHLIFVSPLGIRVYFLSYYLYVWGLCIHEIWAELCSDFLSLLDWPFTHWNSITNLELHSGLTAKLFWICTSAWESLCWPKCTVAGASPSRLLIEFSRLIAVCGGDLSHVNLISCQTSKEFGDKLFLHDCWIYCKGKESTILLWPETRWKSLSYLTMQPIPLLSELQWRL